ncbi:hypothetical protein vB_PsyM_KIL3b_0012 [Pseudomonas phage vB_PsyM_KIL3b]|uniref:Uncharacterized protein n=3 Tax=Pseudomonas phage vB_PsyM_KIL1 TaxID=1777065 RepID=A0A142IFS7_9CAUD|nr:hypothetical protein BH774_gp012 [Pseudomonas phage vB_PsyM_KIL1]AMR57264.1 hypothetical protein vB_PsyM_KIL1_0012 [Pseudomonas phage vB_PsyM_KIL1]AMR57584.1 hypothetical protein vB_PsyM_KIL3_0012 [Pseudomonas phage vB_PsyM_KIL3]AMR58082.1 hypothetical protein vB_PsyM_KIL3b_0012 [Pseudomonas phage vB_PsyM_KIL3b]
MFNDYPCRPGGMVADYSLAFPMKQKCINFYVVALPMVLSEELAFNQILSNIPVGVPYGIRTRIWSVWFPEFMYSESMVSYSVYNELGESVEMMFTLAEFDINTVPWEEVVA